MIQQLVDDSIPLSRSRCSRVVAFFNARAEYFFLAAIPIALSICNDNWLYTHIGYLDPWYNVGYFMHYTDPTYLNWYYKIARLSWLIPGYLIYRIFTPPVANYILHMGPLIVSAFMLFAALRRIISTEIAFLTAAMLVGYVNYHGSGGWDYQTTPSGVYYLIAFYFLTEAALNPGRRNSCLFAAGLAYGACGHANVLFVNMAPILGMHFLAVAWSLRQEKFNLAGIARCAGIVALGVLAITIALGSINALIGRDFLFFKVLFSIVTDYVSDPHKAMGQWWMSWSAMWASRDLLASYLAPLSGVLFASCAVLVYCFATSSRPDWLAVSMIGAFIFVCILWSFWQSLGHAALEPDYMAYPLIPVAFVAVAGFGCLAKVGPSAGRPPMTYYLWVCLLVALPLMFPWTATFFKSQISPLILTAMAAGCAAAVYAGQMSRAPSVLAAALFGILNLMVTVKTDKVGQYVYNPPCAFDRDSYLMLIQAHDLIRGYTPNLLNAFVWWDKNESIKVSKTCKFPLTDFSMSMTSFGSNYLALPWNGMPAPADITDEQIRAIPTKGYVAVVTADPANVERLRSRFTRSNIDLSLAGKKILRSGPVEFYIYILGRGEAQG
jgi:hypothetical protein